MAIVKCKECGGEVSTRAAACPKCGARQPKRTRPLTWTMLALIVVTSAFVMMASDDRGSGSKAVTTACAPIDRKALVLWLDADKREAEADFAAKAERLNASGKCVIEGAFGKENQNFYFAVRDGPSGKPYFLRFTREELAED